MKYCPLQKFQESLQIEILSNVVPWETEPVASIHTKVSVSGKNPSAARLKEREAGKDGKQIQGGTSPK